MVGDCIVETSTRTHKGYQFMKKTLKVLALASVFSFLYSCFSGFPLFFSYNLQFSTLIFPLLAHALDRKYMFLICNGILAFLANNLRISSSTSNYSGFIKTPEDGVKQIPEQPPMLKEEIGQENVVSVEYAAEEQTGQEQDFEDFHRGAEEEILLESEDLEEEDEELNENRVVEVNDASVSTEELNNKVEEFIRKMKEEIRIEAQQPLITV